MLYICGMSNCIVGLRHRVIALFSIFIYFFFLSLYDMLTLKFCVGVFPENFIARMLKLGLHMDTGLLY